MSEDRDKDEVKNCALCGRKPYHQTQLKKNKSITSCANNECPIFDIKMTTKQWNTRPTPSSIKDNKLTFDPDWDKLGASQDALRECMRELNKYADSIKGIEWHGECDNPHCKGGTIPKNSEGWEHCERCNGTREHTRDATLEEVVDHCKKAIGIFNYINKDANIVKNGGILRIKE